MGAINIGGGGSSKKLIEEILAQVHEHDNLTVLDKFDVVNGKLTFNGEEIVINNGATAILASQVIETLDRKFVSATEKEALSGVTDNIQLKINEFNRKFNDAMLFKGTYPTYNEMNNALSSPETGWTVFVTADETDNNSKTIYIYRDKKWLRIRSDKGGAGWIASATEPSTDLLWIDISNLSNPSIKYHNGISWRAISSGGSSLPISANDITEEADRKFVTGEEKNILENLEEDAGSGGLIYNGVLIGGGNSSLDLIDDKEAALDKTYSSNKIENLVNKKQDTLIYTPENIANKNALNGYAGLNQEGLIESSLLVRDAKYKTHFKANAAERLEATLTIPEGDYVYESTTGRLYLKVGTPENGQSNYDANEYWHYVADSYKMAQSAINKLDSEYNPTVDDDSTFGYDIGSIWINVIDKRSYICTDATPKKAQWDLMGGQVNLNVGEIIPFEFDETFPGRVEGQKRFPLPSFQLNESYVEVSLNGIELRLNIGFSIFEDKDTGNLYLDMTAPTEMDDIIHGEIFQSDVSNVLEYMTKSQYDSNHDGKVDRAEVADFVGGLRSWKSGQSYNENNLILKDDIILKANKDFRSGIAFDADNWEHVFTKPVDLLDLSTADLADSKDRRYLTDDQVKDVDAIKGMQTNINNLTTKDTNLENSIKEIKSFIPTDTATSNKLTNLKQTTDLIKKINLKDLQDTPETYSSDAFLKIDNKGEKIEYIQNPRFPIMKMTDRRGNSFNDIYDLELKLFEKESFVDGKLIIAPKIKSSDLTDLPNINKHGGLLVSNKTLMKYDLVKADELFVSQENLTLYIDETMWVQNPSTKNYEASFTHTLDSEALIINVVKRWSKVEDKTVSYQIIDKANVKLISKSPTHITVTVNCSLGVVNGYWSHMFDISKISLINDDESRADRTYSSLYLEKELAKFIEKANTYSKSEANAIFSKKDFEHSHANYNVLNKFSEDINGNGMYNGKKFLTDIKGKMIDISKTVTTNVETEIINVSEIIKDNDVSAVLSSEIIISNKSNNAMKLLIKNGNVILIDEEIPAKGVQKYSLGISVNTIISINGSCEYNYCMSAL